MSKIRDVRGDGEPQAKLDGIPVQVDEDAIVLTGFTAGWLSGKTEGHTFELLTGTGLGNPWAELRIEYDDGSRWSERIDGRELVKLWLGQANARRTASDALAVIHSGE